MSDRLLKLLTWDSDHFRFRIARSQVRKLDAQTCGALLDTCQARAIDCLYFLADVADQDTISELQASSFDFVDIRLTLARRFNAMPVQAPAENLSFRLGHERDVDALLPIASASYLHSRFFIDRRFGRARASQMYEIWLHNSLTTDYADAVVVAELDGRPVGYVTCHLNKPAGEGNIGLVGVAESARGLGCAGSMINKAIRWFNERGFDRVNVVTQGRNIAAQKLYQRSGFVTRSVELWFHKWFTSTD